MLSLIPHLNSLRVFEVTARLMSFKAAALDLNVTPTAVSHQIRGLEEKLSTTLFERKTRSIALTPEGEKLAKVVSQSLQQIATAIEEIMDTQTILTISTTSSFAAMWLVPKLDGFHNANPEIQVVVKTGAHLEDLEKNRRIDLAIRYGELNEQDERSVKLVTEKIGLYATRKYLENLAGLEDATILESHWKNERLPTLSLRQNLKNPENRNLKLKIRHYDQEQHIIQAALAGQGIAVVSSLLTQTALEQGWLEEYDSNKEVLGLTYYMVIPRRNERSRKVEIFRNWLTYELATAS